MRMVCGGGLEGSLYIGPHLAPEAVALQREALVLALLCEAVEELILPRAELDGLDAADHLRKVRRKRKEVAGERPGKIGAQRDQGTSTP